MAVFYALVARFGFLQLVTHVLLEGVAYGTRGSCRCLDAILPEKGDRPPSHSTGQHHVNLLAVNKARHLSWLVLVITSSAAPRMSSSASTRRDML